MASRKERHRIMQGAMNVLPTGDKIGAGESMVLDNWRVDQQGTLRTRGAAVLEQGTFGSGIYHTIRRTSNTRYSGVGTELYFGPEPAGTRLMTGGFDSQPLGMAFYQGFGWVMNRSKQKRILFDEVHNWGIATPTTAPTATAGDQPLKTIESYDGTSGQNHVEGSVDGVTWSVAMDGDVPAATNVVAASFDTSIATLATASLKLLVPAPATVLSSVRPGIPFDTRFSGVAADEDMFRVFVWASDPKAVKSMTVRLVNLDSSGNETAWAEANFKDGSSWDPVKVLSQTPQSWTELLIRRVLNVDSFGRKIAAAKAAASAGTGSQQVVTDLTSSLSQLLHQPSLQIVSASDPQILAQNNTPATSVSAFDWSAVARVYVSFVLTSACEIHLDNFRVVSSSSTALTGSVEYFVSFFNNILQDSNPSPPSQEITVNGQGVTLSNIPVSTDPDALGRYIYRIGGALDIAERVGTIFDNTTTTWVDATSDEVAQDNDEEMPVNRNLPPPARGVIGPYFSKLIAFSTADHPARYFWTPAGIPFAFPGSDDEDIGNWEDCGGDDDELLQVIDHKQGLIFYKQRSIWRLIGDPQTADPVRTNANLGIVGLKAVCNCGALDYFVGPEGVYSFNGDFENKISQPLDPIFKGEWVKLSANDSLPPINRDYIQNTVIEVVNERLRVSYPEFPNQQPTVVAVCNLETGQWCRERYTGLPSQAPTAMFYEGAGRSLVGGFSANGTASLYNLEINDYRADNGTPFRAVWQSRIDDQGLPDNDKSYSDLEIDFETAIDQDILGAPSNSAVSTLSVYLVFNNLTKVLIGTINSPIRKTVILKIPSPLIQSDHAPADGIGYLARNVSVRIEGDIQAVAQIYGTYIHWWPLERWALSFDVGHTDLGFPERAKQCDYIEIYMTASGQLLQRTFWSELPGNLLVVREVATFQAPNGRGTVRFRLPSTVEGRNFRLVVEAPC